MYWHFGGNFKPVATACQYYEWTECLTSFTKYIWFEVVTDVADCLANETVIWRILATLLGFITVAYFVYLKSQWTREVKRNRERFIAVNHKIQDLELKVDIITYKTQYGIWPLQYLQEKSALASFKNFRFGFSNFTLENSWIKNLLARANDKQYSLEKYCNMQKNVVQNYSNIDEYNFPPSSDCDDKVLMKEQYRLTTGTDKNASGCQQNIDNNSEEPLQYLDASQINSVLVPPESNLSDRSKNRILYIKDKIGSRNSHLPRRKSIALDNVAFGQKQPASSKEMKIAASTTNMTVYSKTFSEYQEETSNMPIKDNKFLSKSRDTLLDVQERLETLYKTIHNYNKKNTLVPMLKFESDSDAVNTSEVVSCPLNESNENTRQLEDSNVSWKNTEWNEGECSNNTTAIRALNAPVVIESANNNNHPNCNGTEETCDNFEKFDNLIDKVDTLEQMELHSNMPTDSAQVIEDDTQTFQTVDPLDDLTSALLQEALKFKKQILLAAEKQDTGEDIKEENNLNCSEKNSDSSLKQANMMFESKLLDMITEESSVSSIVEKKGDIYGYKLVEKNKIAQDKRVPSGEKMKRSSLKNTSNIDTLTDEKVKKQKDLNCLSKVNNKSFNSESSSNRKFSSSFSTILLCIDQDNTNICKQAQENNAVLETKSSQDLISLTESSSDVSVNRLITKLIENKRKPKELNQLQVSEKTTMNGLEQSPTNSNDAKPIDPLIELTDSSILYEDPAIHHAESKSTIEENTISKVVSNDEIERLKEISNVPKERNDSVIRLKNCESCNSSEIKTYSDSFSPCSSMPKIQFRNSETKYIDETFSTTNTNTSTAKSGMYSGISLNDNLDKSKLNIPNQYDMLQASKESDETADSISFSSAQKTSSKYNLACNKWIPSRAKSNLDFTRTDKCQFKSTHRRSKSYVNPQGVTNESLCNTEKDLLVSSSSSNQISPIKMSSKQKRKNDIDIRRNRSFESFCSKSSSNIQKSEEEQHIKLKRNYSSSVVAADLNKKRCIKQESSLELVPIVAYSLSKSSIPVMNNRRVPKKSFDTPHSENSSELRIQHTLQDETKGLAIQADKDTDEIGSITISEETALLEKLTTPSRLGSLKKIEQNAIIYYNLVSADKLVPNDINQGDSSDTPGQELIVTDKVVHCRKSNAASSNPNSINVPITCVLTDELSELSSLNSFILQNPIPSLSPYQIERKETEVLVKPSTLDISTSMTSFPCIYHFEEDNNMNDLKIFELSDELTKEECIRYLQMFDEELNCDQSTSTSDCCNKLLQDA